MPILTRALCMILSLLQYVQKNKVTVPQYSVKLGVSPMYVTLLFATRMQEDEMKKIMEERRREKEDEKRAR